MKKVYIPRFLDQEEQLLFFTLKELVVGLVTLGIGILMSQALFGFIFALLAIYIMRWLVRRGYAPLINTYCYWYFPKEFLKMMRLDIEDLPPSSHRNLTG